MTHRTDTYTAVTPFGAVEVDFLEDGGNEYTGDAGAVDYLKSVILQCTGQGGIGLTPESIEPVDLVNFCQPKGRGILIIEPIDSVLEYGPILGSDDDTQVLDAVSPIERVKLTAELAAQSQKLAASTGLNPIQRARLAQGVANLVAQLSGSSTKDKQFEDYVSESEGDTYKAAGLYFKSTLKDGMKSVETAIGTVHFTGAGWKELKRGMKSDALKARLTPFIPEILKSGRYDGKLAPYKARTDGVIAFHFFEKTIDLPDLIVTAGVNVAERENGMFEFTAYGLGHSVSDAWAKRKAADSPGYEPGTAASQSGNDPALDSTVSDLDEECNIAIFRVVDKSTGKEVDDAPEGDPNIGRKWASKDGEIEVVGYFNGDKSKYITTKAGKVFGAPIIPASEIESYIRLDERQAESHARWEKEVAAKEQGDREAKAIHDAEYSDIGGEAGESAMARARRVTALSALIRVDGVIKTKKRMVDDKVAAGETTSLSEEDRIKPMSRTAFNRANNRDQDAHAKRVRDGGKVSVYQLGDSVIDKIAYDYANYLISKTKEAASAMDSAQAATDFIADQTEINNGNEAAQALETETQGSQAPRAPDSGQLDAVTIPDEDLDADELIDTYLPEAVDEEVADLGETLDAVAPKVMTLQDMRDRAAIDRELLAMGMIPPADHIARTYGEGWKMGPARVAPVLDDASMNPIAPVDPTITALAAVAGRMAAMVEAQNAAITSALNAKPAPIELTLKNEPMTVKIEQPAAVVNVTMPEQAPANVVVNIPEQTAPVVHVTNEVPPAQVVVAGPARSISEVERDPQTQEILRTVTTFEARQDQL